MIITDLKFKIVEINYEAEHIVEEEKFNLIGVNLLKVIRKKKVQGWKEFAQRILKFPTEKHDGKIAIGEGHHIKYYQFSFSPVLNKNEKQTGYLFLGLDITHEKLKEKEIIEHSRALQKSNLELERFAYIASHDLKTPLRSVVSFLDLIERRIVKYNDKDLKEFTYHARQGASQMYSLIQDVLEYSKVNNEMKSKGTVDLNETLMSICMNMKSNLKEKNAELVISEMPVIAGEKNHMTQLFGNLIENGIKYNANGTPRVTVNYREESDRHVFAISDNGIGIEKQYYKQIFQMFKRLHTSSYEGSGIGLSICKKIIDLYQGEIWLESKPEQGSVFIFTLALN